MEFDAGDLAFWQARAVELADQRQAARDRARIEGR